MTGSVLHMAADSFPDFTLHTMHAFTDMNRGCDCAQVWNLRPHVKTVVEPLLEQLDLEPKPTIGFHIRGGDKLAEDILGCEMAL